MTLTKEELLQALTKVRVVPVLRSASVREAVELSRGYAQGGLTIAEITFSTPNAEEAIAAVAADANVIVGAGTVTTEKQAAAAVGAGAQFLVSPVWLPWLVDFAGEAGVHAIPGAATPTEVWQAHSAGAAAVKVFPITRLGGAAYIRDLLAPFPDLKLMATGGVDLNQARELINAGCVAVGVGTIGSRENRDEPANVRAAWFLDALSTL